MIKPFLRECQLSLAALMVLLFAVAPGLADEKKTHGLISLTGVGKISVEADIARISSGVVTQAKTAKKATRANSAAMTRIIEGIKAAGIAAKDIQTSGFSINPTYLHDQKNRQNPPKIIGYQVQNRVQITVHALPTLGPILDKMISLGANQINGISFAFENPQKHNDEARKLAVKDAIRKAEIYASATHTKLGRIVSLSESQIRTPTRRFAQRSEALLVRSSVPIEIGELSLSVQVNITWELD